MSGYVVNHNQSLFEITDELHKGLLISWCFILGIFSIIGNTIVIIASVKYKALRLDKVSVTLIKHIGFADVCYALVVILVVGWSLVENRWPLSHVMCHVSVYLQYFLALVDINIIWVLNVAKLTCILYPFRARLRSQNTGYILAASMWLFSNIYPLQNAAMRRTVYFDYRSYRCANLHTPDEWEWLDPLNTLIFFLTPNIIVVVTTVWLLVYTNKCAAIHKQAVVTMVTVSLVFCISYAPIGVYLVAEKWIIEAAGDRKHENFFYLQLYRYGTLVKFINNSINPVIYYLTISSFRKFVREKVFRIKSEVDTSASWAAASVRTRCSTVSGEGAGAGGVVGGGGGGVGGGGGRGSVRYQQVQSIRAATGRSVTIAAPNDPSTKRHLGLQRSRFPTSKW